MERNYNFGGRGPDKQKRAKRGFGQRMEIMKRQLQVKASRLKSAATDPNNLKKAKMIARGVKGEAQLLAGSANRKIQDAAGQVRKTAGKAAKGVNDARKKAFGAVGKDAERRMKAAGGRIIDSVTASPLTQKGTDAKYLRGVGGSVVAAAENRVARIGGGETPTMKAARLKAKSLRTGKDSNK
jgi:hypothetical protein